MALQLEEKYKGTPANYWRINHFQYDDIKGEAIVHLWLYADKTASDASTHENGLKREIIKLTGMNEIQVPDTSSMLPLTMRDLLKTMLYQKITTPNPDPETGEETNKWATAENV